MDDFKSYVVQSYDATDDNSIYTSASNFHFISWVKMKEVCRAVCKGKSFLNNVTNKS